MVVFTQQWPILFWGGFVLCGEEQQILGISSRCFNGMPELIVKSVFPTHNRYVRSRSLGEHLLEHRQCFSPSNWAVWDAHCRTPGSWFTKEPLESLNHFGTVNAAFLSLLSWLKGKGDSTANMQQTLSQMLPSQLIYLPLVFMPLLGGGGRQSQSTFYMFIFNWFV